MASLQATRSVELETRVQDYLNDKIQTAADLESIDFLLQNLQQQHDLLRRQLDEASSAFVTDTNASNDHSTRLRRKAQDFATGQDEIDRRLALFTRSETSDDAVVKFESAISKLQHFDVAQGYLDLLREVGAITAEVRSESKEPALDAIPPYHRLRTLTSAAKSAQPAAEGAAPHLVDHLDQQRIAIYNLLKTSFENDLNQTLGAMGWPNKELKLSDKLLASWTAQTKALLALQEPDLAGTSAPNSNITSVRDPAVLVPLEVMVKPLALRFRYHFYGDKPTNRADKPEYFLSHMLDLLESHNDFMVAYLQPILDEQSQSTDTDEVLYTDATSAFISSLLPMVKDKSLSLLSQISSRPPLLSHFIHELISFDTTLRDSWAYAPVPNALFEWKGLTWSILTTYGYFNAWLSAEKKFALDRYRVIRDSAESKEQDFDSTGPETTKPTKGAIRVNDLLETITDRYRLLSSFSQKLRFLIDIQLAIFDDYHHHLREGLQAYQVNSTIAGKFVQNPSLKDNPSTDVSGLKGLRTLSRVFGSAEYLERKMSDWSDDVFFIELWDELQDRASHSTGAHGSVGRDLSTQEVAARTSATIAGANGNVSDGASDEGALFDETASAYRSLRISSENEIVEALKYNVRGALRPFTKSSGWASVSTTFSSFSDLSPTASLDTALQVLSSQLGYLSTVLATPALRRMTRQLCQSIQRELLDNIVMRQSFSTAGVAQLKRDVTAIQNVIDTTIKAFGESNRGMKKLDEAIILLGLPIKPSSRSSHQNREEDGWDFDDDDIANEEEDLPRDSSPQDSELSLWEVERRVFESNESARRVLIHMGLKTLNENEARTVLRCRVELGG